MTRAASAAARRALEPSSLSGNAKSSEVDVSRSPNMLPRAAGPGVRPHRPSGFAPVARECAGRWRAVGRGARAAGGGAHSESLSDSGGRKSESSPAACRAKHTPQQRFNGDVARTTAPRARRQRWRGDLGALKLLGLEAGLLDHQRVIPVARALRRDETRPVSTGGGTRRVRLVREEGRGASG